MADPQVMARPQVAPLHLTALAVLQRVAADSLRSLEITLESASPIHMMHLSNLGNLRELRLTFWEPSEGTGPKSHNLAALPRGNLSTSSSWTGAWRTFGPRI
jgi:hypothetical protein